MALLLSILATITLVKIFPLTTETRIGIETGLLLVTWYFRSKAVKHSVQELENTLSILRKKLEAKQEELQFSQSEISEKLTEFREVTAHGLSLTMTALYVGMLLIFTILGAVLHWY